MMPPAMPPPQMGRRDPQSALLMALMGGGMPGGNVLPTGSMDPGQPGQLPPGMEGYEADPTGQGGPQKDLGPGMDEGGGGEQEGLQEILPLLLMLLGGGQGMGGPPGMPPGAGGLPPGLSPGGMPPGMGGQSPMGAMPGPQSMPVGGRGGY